MAEEARRTGARFIEGAEVLSAELIKALFRRNPAADMNEVEDVIWGCVNQTLEQGMNIARIAAFKAGLPITVPGMTVNRFCSSGLQAVAMAAHQIVNEGADIAIADIGHNLPSARFSSLRLREPGRPPLTPQG